jgi:hypothetical protein
MDCRTSSNGIGIYTAEQGKAGIGEHQFMITHFANVGSATNPSGVHVYGRYFDDGSQTWKEVTQPGSLSVGNAQGQGGPALAMAEDGTTPQWTVRDPQTNRQVLVHGNGAVELTLTITLGAFGLVEYPLHLTPRPSAPPPLDPNVPDKNSITTYDLTWSDPAIIGLTASAPPYCVDAHGQPDPVVFQQGIVVNPIDGQVTRGAAAAGVITMSCLQGAPATVYRWGYRTDSDLFNAGIQMKRASYCGDAQYFTVAGTQIEIADSDRIQTATPRLEDVEAWWSPTGATCLNPVRERHRGMGFSGTCLGVALLPCPTTLPAAPYLYDAPKHPAP